MNLLQRSFGALTLALYLGFIGLQMFHQHPAITTSTTECQVCTIAHQTPSLVHAPQAMVHGALTEAARPYVVCHPDRYFVLEAHGLAPPLL